MHIALVIGTARKERFTTRVATHLAEGLAARGAQVTKVDVREHVHTAATVPPWGEGGASEVPTAWQQIAATAERFVFVVPEYNHGYPGEFKLLLDSLFQEYEGKPAYIATVSAGTFAGVRLHEHLLPVLHTFKFAVAPTALHVGSVSETLTETGQPADDAFAERAQKFMDAVATPS